MLHQEQANIWFAKHQFPDCYGAVDGSIFPIRKPFRKYRYEEYWSGRKKLYCINTQVIVNGDNMFTDVDVSWPGLVHDARIWRNSTVYSFLRRNITDLSLLGDTAYPIAEYIMTPYKTAQLLGDPNKRRFNDILCEGRVIVEHTLGQMKSRFQTLLNPIRLSLPNIPHFIIACCVLHNVGKYLHDDFDYDFSVMSFDSANRGEEPDADIDNDGTRELGQIRRLQLSVLTQDIMPRRRMAAQLYSR